MNNMINIIIANVKIHNMISKNYKSSCKRINYLKFLYFSTIIVALSSFYIFSSTNATSTLLSESQNANKSIEIDTLLETANTLFNQKNMTKQSSIMTKS